LFQPSTTPAASPFNIPTTSSSARPDQNAGSTAGHPSSSIFDTINPVSQSTAPSDMDSQPQTSSPNAPQVSFAPFVQSSTTFPPQSASKEKGMVIIISMVQYQVLMTLQRHPNFLFHSQQLNSQALFLESL
jgi:hypothetical protein